MHQSTDHNLYKLAVKAIQELITIYCAMENEHFHTSHEKQK